MKHIPTHDPLHVSEASTTDPIVEKHGHLIDKMDVALVNQRLDDKRKSGDNRKARVSKTPTAHKIQVVDNRGDEEPARKRSLPRDPKTNAIIVKPDRSTRPKKTDKVITYRTARQKRESNQQRETHRGNPCWGQPENE